VTAHLPMVSTVDSIPIRVSGRIPCQGWRCTVVASWNRWAGFYCYDHAIRAGWIPGPAQRPGDQLRLAA